MLYKIEHSVLICVLVFLIMFFASFSLTVAFSEAVISGDSIDGVWVTHDNGDVYMSLSAVNSLSDAFANVEFSLMRKMDGGSFSYEGAGVVELDRAFFDSRTRDDISMISINNMNFYVDEKSVGRISKISANSALQDKIYNVMRGSTAWIRWNSDDDYVFGWFFAFLVVLCFIVFRFRDVFISFWMNLVHRVGE